uniref:RING-type E3 ubiquitin transferase n=1 Tax=Strigamia maritima TaxID=126957 RepID=T1IS92_STRMM
MSTETEVCVLCCCEIEIYAYGNCSHVVCHECCTRIRVLCAKTDCPICRQSLSEVYFSTTITDFEKCDFRTKKKNSQYGLIFESPHTERAFEKLLEHSCSLCEDKMFFPTFMRLKDHMKRVHDRFYCNICVDNIKIFSSERQVYDRNELSVHRIYGDTNNKSLRAHPICEFCNERYMDLDDLYRHLRKDHFFCHFCDADGIHEFYNDYARLRDHFKYKHYVCEEGDCAVEQFTSAFRSDIDLKAHKAAVHSRNLSKAKAKQARTIDVNFYHTPRPKHHYSQDEGRSFENSDRSSYYDRKNVNENTSDIKENLAIEKSNVATGDPVRSFDAKDFPTLDKNETKLAVLRAPIWQGGRKQTTINEENDFPSLTSNSSNPSFTSSNWVIGNAEISGSKNKASKPSKPKQAPQVGRKQANVMNDDEFPSLSANVPTFTPSNWGAGNVAVIPVENTTPKATKKIKSISVPLKSNEEFPALKKLSKPFSDNVIVSVKTNQSTERTKPLQKKNLNQNKQTSSSIKEVLKPFKKQDENKAPKSAVEKPYANLTHQNIYEVLDFNGFDDIAPTIKLEQKPQPVVVSFGAEDFPKLEKPSKIAAHSIPCQPKPKLKVSPERDNKLLKSIAKVSVKDDSFSLQGLADSLKATKLSKKKNLKQSSGVENRPASGGPKQQVNGQNNENNNSKPKSNELCGKINLEVLDNKSKKWCEYKPPDNFQQRNFDLIKKIQVMFNNSAASFGDFKTLSGQFRQNEITADYYYEQCMTLLGNSDFSQVFPELLVLLPDIRKQQELLLVNKRLQKNSKSDVEKKVNVCSACQQVLAKQDFAVHKLRHS